MVAEGLRRTGYDEVALTSLSSADFSGIDGVVADLVNEQSGCGSVGLSLPSLRVDAFTVGRRERDPEGPPHRAHVRARGRVVAAPPGDQQADHRRRPLHRGRRRVLAGLAAGEALLPHRPADRDGRGHARHRRARAPGRRHRPQAHEAGELHGVGRRVRAEAAHAVPVVRPERRRGAAAQDQAAARRPQAHAGAGEVARPAATFAEGIASRGDRRIGRVIERVWRAGGTFQEWSEHFRARPLDRRDGRRGARPRLVRHPAPHRRTRSCRGTTSRPGCTRTSSGRTGRRRWPSTGSPIAGGLRATTAGCAPTTPSSTSWRRRSRRRAAARARART